MSVAVAPAESAAMPNGRGFNGVACPRVTSCWAVGDQTASGVTGTLIEHWNGRRWSLTRSPSAAGSADTSLGGVSCSARLDCWAVGSAMLGSTRQEPIAEHWNGRRWSLTVLPEPAGLATDDLSSVWCTRGGRCWAVGTSARRVGGAFQPLAEHWTGKKWSVVATRAPGGFSGLFGVFCRRDTNCWAVGSGGVRALAEHWNGRRWSVVATPFSAPGLSSVWCPGTVCIATGTGGFPSAIAERWNGRKWSLTRTAPLPPGTVSGLPGVSCTTSVNCFAGGFANRKALIEHWQGSKWVRVKITNPAGVKSAVLVAVFCSSKASCWVVGRTNQGFTNEGTLAEHWNGRH
jgi:hypothetical protein